ncbi:MAG: hypothetical protein AAGF87_01695 [Bacteroidota bacterium]
MNKQKFIDHFIMCCEAMDVSEGDAVRADYEIELCYEEGKKKNTIDDMVRLAYYSQVDFSQIKKFDQVMSVLAVVEPKFPLWIRVILTENSADYLKIKLEVSMRFRNPTQLHNQEAGYPPFAGNFRV